MSDNITREITPLTQGDCFMLFERTKKEFDFPLHYHDEYELNLILNAQGAKRVIGDHIDTIDSVELVLVGPNLKHAWFTHECKSKNIIEITIQFHKSFLDEQLLKRNQLSFIQIMFEHSLKGILFSAETINRISPRIMALKQKTGFDSVLELLSILHDLSISRNFQTLSASSANNHAVNFHSRRIEKVFEHLHEYYFNEITLAEAAKIANMPEVSFSRFIKKRTGKTFVESLNEIRLGNACRMLIDSTKSIAEIAFDCGFNNISNFNRLFKKRKNTTPKDFRESYSGVRVFI